MKEIEEYIKQIKLLYVEDDSETRVATIFLLEEFFEEIIVAVDGKDGLNKFKENEIDLVLTDMSMPHMDGLEMSEQIKKIDKDTFILMFSAHNEADIVSRSMETGIDGYLFKPINFEQFTEALHKAAESLYLRQKILN